MFKKFLSITIILCFCISTCCCTYNPKQTIPDLIWDDLRIINWSPDSISMPSLRHWQAEAEKYLVSPVILACHGEVGPDGHWTLYPDPPLNPMKVEEGVRYVKSIYPTNPLVLVVCNPGHKTLNEKNVWYSKESMWLRPDNSVPLFASQLRDISKPEVVGKFEELVTNED